ncbi:hypothetical protein AB0A74_38320 [Saccharothrix sp. NPDC042600]|uniref:hypothetical protein n=1 Tax=Saccharothrix TaxID=2071 RepID=UPI0033E73C32|nr:hypothetical protein GCM10017745_36180 [Saccharothrix mutabilis subsp. capreolus]
MNRSTRVVPALLAALLLGGCGGTATTAAPTSPSAATTTTTTVDRAAEQEAVRKAFEDYRTALRAKDGKAAVKVVSDEVLSWYVEMKELALKATPERLGRLGFSTHVLVYGIRAQFGAADLRAMSSADILAATVDKGLLDADTLEKVELGTIVVEGETARAQFTTRDGAATGLTLPFHKEFGLWKFDYLPLLFLGQRMVESQAERDGLTVEEVVDLTLVATYGQERAAELKQPLEG